MGTPESMGECGNESEIIQLYRMGVVVVMLLWRLLIIRAYLLENPLRRLIQGRPTVLNLASAYVQ